ncbi:MAG: stage III sporulation protein AE [Bacillota bacterium]|jgi:stage III sporulation protein AE
MNEKGIDMARLTKIIIFFCLLFFLLGIVPSPAWATSSEPFAVMNNSDMKAMDDYLNQLDKNLDQYLHDFSLKDLWQQAKNGEVDLSVGSVFTVLSKIFFKEVHASWALLGQLILLAIISLILGNLGSAFEKENVSLLAKGVVYLLLAAIAISSFSISLNVAKEAVETMSGFLYAVLPLLMMLLAAMGGITSVGILHPSILFALTVLMNIMSSVIFPLIYFSAILRLVSHISPKFNVNKLAGLFKDISLGFMSIGVSVFIAFMGIAGMATAAMDGLAVKAAKTASGIFIPVVGRSLADAMDSVLGTALVLKNGIGVVGIIAIFLICAMPAAKILVQVIIFRLAAAVVQPLGDNQLADALSGLSNALLLLFAAVAVCGLLFFFVLAICIGAGNITMMMR